MSDVKTVREKLIHALKSLSYAGLSAPESRRLTDYLRGVLATVQEAQRTSQAGILRKRAAGMESNGVASHNQYDVT